MADKKQEVKQVNNLFPALEEEVLNFWEKNKIFEKSVKKPPLNPLLGKKGKNTDYVFYDGPPFATGTPHYGHIVASTMKDVVPRYWTMKGYRVERKWGWDCHGLPIENITEKEIGIKNKKEIENLGVEKFNEICCSKVLGYVKEWQKIIRRLGRWADLKNAYKTMDLDFMESVWWVFKQLWDKRLIYEGYRSMYICPRCETTLSQQEIAEGYKMVKDLSVTVKFKITNYSELKTNLTNNENVYILAWTTTPWTLIGNVALAVNKSIKYQALSIKGNKEKYLVARERVKEILKGKEYKIVGEVEGKDLVGLNYQPLFDYYSKDKKLENKENGWKIYAADFVTIEEGTGVVHIAPAFGEDDMNLGKEYNLPFIQHINMDGTIKAEVKDFVGMNVKPAEDTQKTDVEIIKYLANKNLLFAKEKYEHSYPHCWRCETPLINYATTSWFVAVTKVKDRALELASRINWSPAHIKEGRFGNWLAGARDWSISRQRFWASVMPIWKCECGEIKVFGSVAELEQASGEKITDLHKHIVDKITLKCANCSGVMKRVPDVLDAWFDSGSMPYAQMHYPFANKEKFEANFPAEFIAEGVDQTRAWFYYLHIIATAIKDKAAFKNVIVNGIVLAEDGKKMSKRLNNYPDPEEIFNKYGADAMRYYLISSPVMAAENLNFSEDGVKESFRKINMILWNVYKFYELFSNTLTPNPSPAPNVAGEGNKIPLTPQMRGKNVLDKWILARLNQLIGEITESMDKYNLPKAVRPIGDFINDLSTWYLRRSRDRFKALTPNPSPAPGVTREGNNKVIDKQVALATTGYVLLNLAKVMAPFLPFLAEQIWQKVSGFNFQDENKSVHLESWPKIELRIKNYESRIIKEMELVRKIVELGLAERDKAGIKVRQALRKLEVRSKKLELNDEYINLIKDELNVKIVKCKKGKGEIKVELDTELTEELKLEGVKREIVRLINMMRKEAGLTIQDRIILFWQSEGKMIKQALAKLAEEIKKDTLASEIKQDIGGIEASREVKINSELIILRIAKK